MRVKSALAGEGGGALDILAPNGNRFDHSHFRSQKSLDFQGPPLPIALVMDLARLKTITYHAI
jgi:hypothetical protein